MFKVSGNPRVIESMDLISQSMLAMIRNRPYSDISITDICENAGVSRKTFYRNFETKEDIVNYILHRKMSEITDQLNLTASHRELFVKFMNYWKKEGTLVRMLYQNNLWDMFTYCLSIYTDLLKLQETALDRIPDLEMLSEYYYPLYASILATLVKNWTKRKYADSIDQLYAVYQTLLSQ